MRESPSEHIRNAMQLVLSLSDARSQEVHDQLANAALERLKQALDGIRAERQEPITASYPL